MKNVQRATLACLEILATCSRDRRNRAGSGPSMVQGGGDSPQRVTALAAAAGFRRARPVRQGLARSRYDKIRIGDCFASTCRANRVSSNRSREAITNPNFVVSTRARPCRTGRATKCGGLQPERPHLARNRCGSPSRAPGRAWFRLAAGESHHPARSNVAS